jgi:predicted MFS family arabinose efflux permease
MKEFINTVWFELALVNAGFAFGSILLSHFEERTPKLKKVLKLILFNIIIASLYLFLGRTYSLGFIIFILILVILIHAVILPLNGINGLTGEPKEKYYKFRGWKK